MMRIGIVSQWYPPENTPIPWSIATELVDMGHDIRVLTTFPNYPRGKIFDGYRQRWHHVETQGSVKVRRVPVYPSHDTNGMRRAATFTSFALTSTATTGFLRACDVVYVYATPMTAASAAAAARLVYGRPYVLHIQDLWPDSVVASGMAGGHAMQRIVSSTIGRIVGNLYRGAFHLIAIAPSMKQVLVDRGVPASKISVVHNWNGYENLEPHPFEPVVRARLGRPGRTLAVFAGNIGQMQDVATVVRAAALVRDTVPLDIAIVGSGPAAQSVRRLASDVGADNVRFLGEMPSSEMPAIYAASDYQLVTLKDSALFHATIPSKLGAALSHGCPVITTAPGDVTAMVSEGGFGFSCVPENPHALAEIFRLACGRTGQERSKMAHAAREYYQTKMSMHAAITRIETVLTDAVDSTSPRRGYGDAVRRKTHSDHRRNRLVRTDDGPSPLGDRRRAGTNSQPR